MTDMISSLADQIIALINSSPRSPNKEEVERAIRLALPFAVREGLCDPDALSQDAIGNLYAGGTCIGWGSLAKAPPQRVQVHAFDPTGGEASIQPHHRPLTGNMLANSRDELRQRVKAEAIVYDALLDLVHAAERSKREKDMAQILLAPSIFNVPLAEKMDADAEHKAMSERPDSEELVARAVCCGVFNDNPTGGEEASVEIRPAQPSVSAEMKAAVEAVRQSIWNGDPALQKNALYAALKQKRIDEDEKRKAEIFNDPMAWATEVTKACAHHFTYHMNEDVYRCACGMESPGRLKP